jgi:peptidoglycan hydrolase CwlO-like protein
MRIKWLFVVVILVMVVCGVAFAEEYAKVDDNTVKVSNLEAYLPINGKQVKAIIPEIDFTYEQLQNQAEQAQKQYDSFKARADRHLTEMQKEIDIANARFTEAEKAGIKAKDTEPAPIMPVITPDQ